jgi:hypothetical protein
MTPAALLAAALENPVNAALLARLPALGLPQGYLTAGCLFQAVWNRHAGRPPEAGVKDYDVFYFDDRDLSWDAEDAVIRRVAAATAELGVTVEVKNQARVHLWYPERFGEPYPPLRSARDGIDRYLVACTCVGVALDGARYAALDSAREAALGSAGAPAPQGTEVYTPDSLEDLAAGVLRPNPRHPSPVLFRAKAADYRARWPWLTVFDPTGPA